MGSGDLGDSPTAGEINWEDVSSQAEHSIVLVMQTISDGDEMESVQRHAFDEGGGS
jgi:hypothetical protein